MKKEKSILKGGATHTEVVIDKETGEIISTEIKRHTYIANTKEEFMFIYVTLFPIFIGLSAPAKSLYIYILSKYPVNTEFEIADGSRRTISEALNIGRSSVSNALLELKNRNLIFSRSRSMYQINPRYAYKGSTADRANALKAIIEIGLKSGVSL